MTAVEPKGWRRTACMLTVRVDFVMSSVGFLNVGQSVFDGLRFGPVNTGTCRHRAKCTPLKCHHCKLQPFASFK
jgi:hypothetical protein